MNCAPAHEHCRRVKDKDDVGRITKAKRQKANHSASRSRSAARYPEARRRVCASEWTAGRAADVTPAGRPQHGRRLKGELLREIAVELGRARAKNTGDNVTMLALMKRSASSPRHVRGITRRRPQGGHSGGVMAIASSSTVTPR